MDRFEMPIDLIYTKKSMNSVVETVLALEDSHGVRPGQYRAAFVLIPSAHTKLNRFDLCSGPMRLLLI